MMQHDDDVLLDELRAASTGADPLPELVLAHARAAFETRDLDARLARLVADSLDPAGGQLEAVRGGGTAGESLLLFEAGPIGIDLAVHDEPGGVTLIGTITGAGATECVIERGDGERLTVEVDALGRFLVPGVAPGPLRLRCRPTAGGVIVTPWTNV